jgi:3-oxoacyl-[acyl-carrier-protein] synthase III
MVFLHAYKNQSLGHKFDQKAPCMESGAGKKETQIRQSHGTSQFSKAIVPFAIHTILKHPTKIEFIMSIPLQIYQIYPSFAARIRGRLCVANEHCCVVLKSSWFGRSSQTHLWT